MSVTSRSTMPRLRYHPNAQDFVFDALQYTQQKLKRPRGQTPEDDEEAHITGQELLDGIRELAQRQFGFLARVVFTHWGVTSTEDFGRIVFDLIAQGKMRKTERDTLDDFVDVYDFEEALQRDYRIDTRHAFR